MTNPEPAGYVPPPGTPLVTQADRWQWQYRATRALAAILDAHPGLPAITWTLTQTGSLAGQVNGIGIPPDQARATFTAWQRALRIDSVKESPIRDTGMIALTGRTYHGMVLVGLTTRLYYPLPDDEALAETPPAAPPSRSSQAAASAPHATTELHRSRDRILASPGRSSNPARPTARTPLTPSEAATVSMTPGERRLRAQIAANARWSKSMAREDQAYLARNAFFARMERQIDPEGKLLPEERAKLVRAAAREHAARLNAAKARKRARDGSAREEN